MTRKTTKTTKARNARTQGSDAATIADAIVEEATSTAPAAKKTRKAATKKPKAEPKAEANEPPKPEPVVFNGIELKEGYDAADAERVAKEMQEAAQSIANKDADLLPSYLAIGHAAHMASNMFKSMKLWGQWLKDNAPETQAIDPSLRSNSKWLWEALNVEDHEASGSLLNALGVNDIASFKSANPTVIKREFKNWEKRQKAANELGVDADDEEALAAAEKEAKEAEAADAQAHMDDMMGRLEDALTSMPRKDKIAAKAVELITKGLTSNRANFLEAVEVAISDLAK